MKLNTSWWPNCIGHVHAFLDASERAFSPFRVSMSREPLRRCCGSRRACWAEPGTACRRRLGAAFRRGAQVSAVCHQTVRKRFPHHRGWKQGVFEVVKPSAAGLLVTGSPGQTEAFDRDLKTVRTRRRRTSRLTLAEVETIRAQSEKRIRGT